MNRSRINNAIQNVRHVMAGCVSTSHTMVREWAAIELDAIDGGGSTIYRAIKPWAKARGVVLR